jgi:hypothetical protein
MCGTFKRASVLNQSCFRVCVVLAILATPSGQNIPFLSDKPRNKAKTLQSLCLVTLCAMNVYELVHFLWGPSVEELVTNLVLVSSASPATTPLVYFLAVDKLTNALVYAFGWFYFEDSQQRVCSVYRRYCMCDCRSICGLTAACLFSPELFAHGLCYQVARVTLPVAHVEGCCARQ